MNTLTVSLETLIGVSPEARLALLWDLGVLDGITAFVTPPNLAGNTPTGAARLTDQQADELVAGVGPKIRAVLEEIAARGEHFAFADLLAALKIPLADRKRLGPVWAGLTKRTKTVTGSPTAKLIVWADWDNPARTSLTLDGQTHAALRQALI